MAGSDRRQLGVGQPVGEFGDVLLWDRARCSATDEQRGCRDPVDDVGPSWIWIVDLRPDLLHHVPVEGQVPRRTVGKSRRPRVRETDVLKYEFADVSLRFGGNSTSHQTAEGMAAQVHRADVQLVQDADDVLCEQLQAVGAGPITGAVAPQVDGVYRPLSTQPEAITSQSRAVFPVAWSNTAGVLYSSTACHTRSAKCKSPTTMSISAGMP